MKPPPIPDNETQRLSALYALNILDTPPEERFDRITRLAQRMFDVPIALISLIDAERQWFKSGQTLPLSEVPRSISFCGHTILENGPLIVTNALDDKRFVDNPVVANDPQIRFYAGQALHTPDGYAVGTLCLVDDIPREFSNEDRETLKDLAAIVESELNLREVNQLQQQLSAANQALQKEMIERQEAASQLQLTQFAVDQAVDPIFWVDQTGKFRYVNKAASRLWKYPSEKLLTMSIQQIDPNYEGQAWLSHWKAIRQRHSFTVETQHLTETGQAIPVEVTFNYLEFEGAAYNCGFVRDITWRRWAMEELMESEERFQQVIASISDYIYVTELTDGQPTNTYISPTIESLTGHPLEKFIGNWGFWRTLIHPDDAPVAQEQFDRFESGRSGTTEYRLMRADGEIIWVRDSGQVQGINVGDREILTIYGVISDITQRKLAEGQLRESEEKFRTLVEYAPEAIVIIDEQSQITLVNDRAEQMFGYERAELIGQSVDLLLPEDFREQHRQHRRRYLAAPEIRPMGRGLSLVAQQKDGTVFPVEIGLSFTETKGEKLFISYITDITERQQAEEARRQSEERLQQVLTSISDHIYVTEFTADGQRLNRYLSPVEPLTGYAQEQVMTDWTFWAEQIIHPADREMALAQSKRFAQGQNSEVEYRLVKADGSTIWVRDSGRVERPLNGSGSLMVYGVVSDITARKEAETALQDVAAENLRLARAVESATEGIVISDPTQPGNPLIYINSAFTNITGYSAEESLGRNCRFLQGLDTNPDAVAEIRQGIRDQRHIKVTLLNYRKDGQPFWNELDISPIFSEEGELLYFVGIQADVTTRIQAEINLRKSEARYRILAEYATDMITRHDAAGVYLYVSPASRTLLGYEPEDLVGHSAYEFFHANDLQAIQESHTTVTTSDATDTVEYRIRKKDGQYTWFETTSRSIYDDANNVREIVAVSRDISERKKAESERIHFTNQLRTAADVSRQIAAILEPDSLIEAVVTLLQSRFDLYHVHIYLLDSTSDELLMHTGSGQIGQLLRQRGHKIPVAYEHSLVALAARRREVVVVNDVSAEPDFMPNPLLPETKAEVAVPLIIGEQVLGVFDVQDNRLNRFSQPDLDTFRALSGQIAVALQNARLFAEQRQTEQALRQSESRNRAILDALPDLMFRLNREGAYLDYKTNSPEELYLPPETFMGKTLQETLPPDLADLTLHHIRQALEINQLQVYEYELADKDQLPETFEARLTVSGEEEVLAIVRNITERKQAEAAAAQRARLNAFSAAVGLALTQQFDVREMLQDCTQAMVDHLGAVFGRIWTFNEAEAMLELQASAGMYTHLDGEHSRIPYGQLKIGMIAKERRPTLTNDLVNTPGISDKAWVAREGMVAFAGYPLIVDKSLVGVMAMFARDQLPQDTLQAMEVVANTIAVSIARKQAEAALRESQQMLSYHLQNTPVGFIQWNLDFEVEAWNPAAETIFGYTHQEAIGRHASFIIPEEIQAYVGEVWDALLSQTGGKRSTNENMTKDGRRIICDWDNTPLLDADGNLLGVASLIQDITDRVQAQKALAQARDEALEASRLKSELLAKVSHELRTPLTAIMGFAEMMEFGIYDVLTEKQTEPVSEIIDSTQYLTNLVNELLDQAQLDAGQLKLNMSDFNPITLVEVTYAKMHVLAQAKDVLLTTQITDNTPRQVRGDEARIRQILVNLISNAIKFTDEGTVNISLCRFDNHRWAIRVSDTGQGIPPEDQAKIFEAFQQVDGSVTRRHRGHGLGLSIVRQLTSLMGGEVQLKSKVGKGSTFTVILPIQPNQGDTA